MPTIATKTRVPAKRLATSPDEMTVDLPADRFIITARWNQQKFDEEERERKLSEREALAAERERELDAERANNAKLRAENEDLKRCRFLWSLSLSDTTT